MRAKTVLVFELELPTEEQRMTLGHLTYHAGKLWNEANYMVRSGMAKPYMIGLYRKLRNTSICLRSSKRIINADVNGTGMGVCGSMHLPQGIMAKSSCQTYLEALLIKAG